MERTLDTLNGVGSARKKALNEAGIREIKDLLAYLPREYRDLTHITPLCDLTAKTDCAVKVTVVKPASVAFVKKLTITRAVVSDGTDEISCVWYNQPWLKGSLTVGRRLLLYGHAEEKNGKLIFSSPSVETEEGLIPVYKPIVGVPARLLRQMIGQALSEPVTDPLPESIRKRFALCTRGEAYRFAHMPENAQELQSGLYRMSFENLLMFQLATGIMHKTASSGVCVSVSDDATEAFWKTLPFPPTGAQKRVLDEIACDMRAAAPMARLVQGDVGSGKTAVAFGAIFLAAKDGWQSAMMAPTEILACQHYESARQMLEPLGISCGLLTGSMTKKQHEEAKACLKSGKWAAAFGTHALITEDVTYARLGLVVTDEQHRFGVRQRSMLGEKGNSPNVLVMSATPIPRTLALILYGDLELSVIDELPPGRKPVRTRIVPERKRQDMYGFIREEVRKGRQVYFVCPLVEESEAVDAQSAELLYESLKNQHLSDLRVCMVHGKMRPKEKEEILAAFRRGETDVLVSTTVIEVGVNVPNASVMVVENAERFGLAQLHQLRGRVGRGTEEAWCFLMAEGGTKLKIMTETNDGFKIAEKDMEIRGPGDMFGTRQSGTMMDNVMNAATDAQTLKITHEFARELLHRPPDDAEAQTCIALAVDWLNEHGNVALAVN